MCPLEIIFYVSDAVYNEFLKYGDCSDAAQDIFKIIHEIDIDSYDIRTYESDLDEKNINW